MSTLAITAESVAETLMILERGKDLATLLAPVAPPIDDTDATSHTQAIAGELGEVIALPARDELARAVGEVAAAIDEGRPAAAGANLGSGRDLVGSFVNFVKAEASGSAIVSLTGNASTPRATLWTP